MFISLVIATPRNDHDKDVIKIQNLSLIANIIEMIFLKSGRMKTVIIRANMFLQDIGKKAILSSQLGICAITCVSMETVKVL